MPSMWTTPWLLPSAAEGQEAHQLLLSGEDTGFSDR
jgi:hypothetical protein